uniref:Uncharacterized protein n=1 Tax=Mus spicilegus TaxID=10103 RepID=A0A8C6IGA7_MUSSI
VGVQVETISPGDLRIFLKHGQRYECGSESQTDSVLGLCHWSHRAPRHRPTTCHSCLCF